MATATFESMPASNTDAEFRAWGKGISDALAAVGLVKTADTGQINWATVIKPATGYVFPGYEIWRFNDALQATAPIFVKVEYGGVTNAYPGFQITLGKGSNGSGVLTGITHTAQSFGMQGIGTVPTTSYVYGGEGAVIVVPWGRGGAGYSSVPYWAIERSRDAAGNPTATTVIFMFQGNLMNHIYASASPVPGHATGMSSCCAFPLATANPAASGTAPVFPMVLADGISAYWQAQIFLYGHPQDIVPGLPVTVGGRGTYMPFGTSTAGNFRALLMKWQ